MSYRYTYDQWLKMKKAREDEDRDSARAYAEDMDMYSALREEQHRTSSADLRQLAEGKGL